MSSANLCNETASIPDGKGTLSCTCLSVTLFSFSVSNLHLFLFNNVLPLCYFYYSFFVFSVKTNPTVWSPMQSIGGVLGTEALPDSDPCVFTSEDTMDGLYNLETDGVWGGTDSSMLWTCVAAGAVSIDPVSPPNWYAVLRHYKY